MELTPTLNNEAASTNTTPPSPRASGEASNCTAWIMVESYTTCKSILAVYDLTMAEFYMLNPSVGSDCSGLAVGTYYCLSWFPDGDNPADWGYQATATWTGSTTATTSGDGISTPTAVQVRNKQHQYLSRSEIIASN